MYRNIHIGKEIEKRISDLKLTKTDFAKKIGTSKQNLNRILEKESIETSLLQKFGEALNYNFFKLFIEPPLNITINAKDHSGASGTGDVILVNDTDKKLTDPNNITKEILDSNEDGTELELLKKDNESLRKLLEAAEKLNLEKERTINVLNLLLEKNNIK